MAADIKLTLGIDVEESKQNVDSQVRKILKNVSDVATPLKIRIDEKSFRGDVAELQAILKNIFRSAGIDLSGLIKVGSSKGIGEYTASLRAITGEVENSRQTLLNLSTVLQSTFKSGAPGLSEIQQQMSQVNPELQRYIQLINTAEASLRGQTQKYYGLGGADPTTLSKMTVAYKELASARAAFANTKVEQGDDGAVLMAQVPKGKKGYEWIELSSVIQKVIADVKTYESELRNLNSMLDAESKAEARAAKEARAAAQERAAAAKEVENVAREIPHAINPASPEGVDASKRLLDAMAKYRRLADEYINITDGTFMSSPVFGAIPQDMDNISAAMTRLGESRLTIRELNSELALASEYASLYSNELLRLKEIKPSQAIDPNSEFGANAAAGIQGAITKLRDLETEYTKLIKNTTLSSWDFGGISEDVERLGTALVKLKDLENPSLTFERLDSELARITERLSVYRDELSRLKADKSTGNYDILSGDTNAINRITGLQKSLLSVREQFQKSGGIMETLYGSDVDNALDRLNDISNGFANGGVNAQEFAGAVEQANAVLAMLNQAQAGAAMPDAVLEKGTKVYDTARGKIQDLSNDLDRLGKQYLNLGHIDFSAFNANGGALSFNGVRAGLDEFVRKLEAGEITNEQYAQTVAIIKNQLEALAISFDEVSTKEQSDKLLSKTMSDYRSKMNLAAGAQKWTSAKFDPRTAESYKQLAVSMREMEAAYREFATNQDAPGAFDKFSAAVRRNGEAIDKARANMELYGKNTMSFATRLGEKFKTLLTYTIGARVIYGSIGEIRKLISTATELDTAMGQLRIVTDETESSYVRFGKTASDTAREIGASMKDIIDATTTYARLGYSLDESSVLSKYTAMLSKVGDIQTSQAQDAITSMIKAFNIDATQAENIETLVDKLVKVGKEIAQGYSNVA